MSTRFYTALRRSYYDIANSINIILSHYQTYRIANDPSMAKLEPFSTPSNDTLLTKGRFHMSFHSPSSPLPPDPFFSPCGSPRQQTSIRDSLTEISGPVEFHFEIPLVRSPAKNEDFPVDIRRSLSADDWMESSVSDLKQIEISFAKLLAEGLSQCSQQLWEAHDRLTAVIRECVGVMVEQLHMVHERNLRDFYSRFILLNRLSVKDLSGEVEQEDGVIVRVAVFLRIIKRCLTLSGIVPIFRIPKIVLSLLVIRS